MILIIVWHEITLPDWYWWLLTRNGCKVVWWISVLVHRAVLFLVIIQCAHRFLQNLKFLWDELFKIISYKPEILVFFVELTHCFSYLLIIAHKINSQDPIIYKLMQKMSYMCVDSPIFASVRVRNSWPVKLKQTPIFSLINVSIVNSFYSLSLKSQKMLYCYLWMWVAKAISCPCYFHLEVKSLA